MNTKNVVTIFLWALAVLVGSCTEPQSPTSAPTDSDTGQVADNDLDTIKAQPLAGGDSVHLAWPSVGPNATYSVFISELGPIEIGQSFGTTEVATLITNTSFVVENLNPGTVYYFLVIGNKSVGEMFLFPTAAATLPLDENITEFPEPITGGGGVGGGGAPTAFKVTSVVPNNHQTNVPTTTQVAVHFTKDIDCANLIGHALTVYKSEPNNMIVEGGAGIAQDLIAVPDQCNGDKLFLDLDLKKNTTYTVRIHPLVKSADGEYAGVVYPLEASYDPAVWSSDQVPIFTSYFSTGDEVYIDNVRTEFNGTGFGDCPGRTVAADLSGGAWSALPGNSLTSDLLFPVQGDVTYWANQPLKLRVENNCAAGWYHIRTYAKNVDGPLPSFYEYFNIDVSSSDRHYGNLVIEADDDSYHAAMVAVYVPTGDSELTLNWTNDAYLAGVYDANINLLQVDFFAVDYNRRPKGNYRAPHQYCDRTGKWEFTDQGGSSISQGAALGFCFDEHNAGQHEFTLRARFNGFSSETNQVAFNVIIGGISHLLTIPAGSDFAEASVDVVLLAADKKVLLEWANQSPGQSIEIRHIELKPKP